MSGSEKLTPRRWKTARTHVLVLGLYVILAIIVTWPILPNFTSGVVGELGGVDAFLHVWNHWWVAEAVAHGQSPFFSTMLYWPVGIDMFWQTVGFAQGLAALPITWTLGPIAGLNWTVISGFFLSGYFTFLFVRSLTHHTPAALLAGMIYAFSPFHLEKMIDGNVVAAIQWIPAYLFAFHTMLNRPRWWLALLSGLLLIWVSLGSMYYGLFCGIYTGLAVLVWMLFERKRWLQIAIWGALPLLIWGALIVPRVLLLAQTGDTALGDYREFQAMRSADVFDFFLPNPVHPLWGQAIRDMRDRLYPNAILWNVALGWVGIALGAIGIIARRRETARWSILLGATLLLAMGTTLNIAGFRTGIPLPYALIEGLPGIRANQRPNHMVVVSSLLLAIIAAYGVIWLMQRWARTPRAVWSLTAGLLVVLMALDGYAGTMSIQRRVADPFYSTLRSETPDGALMPLPLYYHINRSDNLWPQTIHEWPILGGYVARPPLYPFIDYTPGVRELERGEVVADDIVTPGWPDSGRRGLANTRVRYVTLDLTSNKDRYFEQVRQRLQELGVGEPIVKNDALEVYALPRDWNREPVASLGDGWQALERQEGTDYRWRWMGESATIKLMNPFDTTLEATIDLKTLSFEQPRKVQVQLDGENLQSLTAPNDTPQTTQLRFSLPPGEHTITLQTEASPVAGRDQPISIRIFAIAASFREP